MIGHEDWQEDLFIPGNWAALIPDDHILKQVDRVLDFSWLAADVRDCYCSDGGRPSIPPEVALRLMIAGFFQQIVKDRQLMREAQVNLAIRWFARLRLDQAMPDHSSLTRIRQRWGAERFKRIFTHSVQCCLDAGLVSGEVIHVDGTLVRADVSWSSVVVQYAEQTLAENVDEGASSASPVLSQAGQPKKRSTTDPDASLATARKGQPMEPCFKQFTAVDSQAGIIVDVAVATGEADEGAQVFTQLERVAEVTGIAPTTLTADSRLGIASVYTGCEERQITAIIPPQRLTRRKHERIPACHFRYDPVHRVVTCPGRHCLYPSARNDRGWVYQGVPPICQACPLRAHCIAPSARVRVIVIVDGFAALLRARREKARGWDATTRACQRRHRGLVEGVHGEAKCQHGFRRALRRGLANFAMQSYLTATVINIKRLARGLFGQIAGDWRAKHRLLMRCGVINTVVVRKYTVVTTLPAIAMAA